MLWLTKAKSFALAVWSFIRWGDTPLSTYNVRVRECWSCPLMKATETGMYCKKCDCPDWALSDLRSKWRMPDLKCPLDKW